MKKGLTDITIILYRSFSMQPIRESTIGGVNQFIESQKLAPGEAVLSLCLFDDQYDRPINAQRIHEVPPLNDTTYVPRGDTCLYGAIGTAVHETGQRLSAQPESERPEHVIILIVTDGEENSSNLKEWSKQHTKATIRQAIEQQTSVYKWKFQYIGANQDAITNAANIGIQAKSAVNYTSNNHGTRKLYGDLSSNIVNLRACVSSDIDFTADQLQAQMDAKNEK